MKPTEILSSEHRVIETMLVVLERVCERAEQSGRVDREDGNKVITFIRMFADKCHHGKEEGELFPAMEAKGVPCESGPIGVMLSEHEQGRRFVRGMVESLEDASSGDSTSLRNFIENALSYVLLLRAHIQKEDRILFPMADRLMSAAETESLLQRFNVVESDHMGTGTHERFLEMAEGLALKYGVDKQWTAATTQCTCSHHH